LNNDSSMDNQRFNKFCKDCKIIDGKNITSTDCDIIFNKMKSKGARRIEWNTFVSIFRELAQKKYPSKNSQDAYIQLLAHVADKGPIARGTVTETSGVYDKLLDTAGYTGMHKERFNADGTGRGLEGRNQPTSTLTQQQITNRSTNSALPSNTQNAHTINGTSTNSVGAAKKRGQTAVVTGSVEQLDMKNQPPKRADQKASNSNLKGSNMSINKGSNSSLNKKSNSSLNKATTANYSSTKSGGGGASVFDRLTNVNGYTGTHKERFNADGTGRGISGREQNTGSLTQAQVTNRSSNSNIRSST
jgi:hypothetical protein